MKIIRDASRIIVGFVFIFSGIVKAIDPLGSVFKFHDYFLAFNIGFLDSLSLPLAILLCTAEFIAGYSLVTGIRIRSGIWIALVLMAVFTPLTFVLALTNPVTDCGCFGDAIHLTNWQTFWKNVILIILVIFLFTERKKIKILFSNSIEWSVVSIVMVLFILFSLFNLRYLPIIDFLPYKKGIKIAEKMIIPEGSEPDEYMTTFIYVKDGIEKEFNLDNYPADDTAWKFVDQKSILVKKGYQPPIHDFSITSTDGEDLTDNILSHQGYSLLMISKKLDEAASERLAAGFVLGAACLENGIDFYVLSASGSTEVRNFDNGLIFCSGDETTLKTMIRSNPGYILLREGTIIEKWSWANVPGKDWFDKLTAHNL